MIVCKIVTVKIKEGAREIWSYTVGRGEVRYSEFYTTRPKEGCGLLCAFSSISSAMAFISGEMGLCPKNIIPMKIMEGCELWECIAEVVPDATVKDVYDSPTSKLLPADLPLGTVLCNSIRLIEVIGPERYNE